MCTISIFPCIMTMISNFTNIFIFEKFIFKFFFTNIIYAFSYDFGSSFVNDFIFFFLNLVIFISCSCKNSQNFFMQSLPLPHACLFSMLLNDDIEDIEKGDGICFPTVVVNEFSGLFLQTSIFFVKY